MAQSKKETPYHHGELREALVSAGRKLLEEKGLRGFTLRECARRAGVSHAAPAHHFASLNDLLAEIGTRGFAELTEMMASEARRAGTDATRRLVGQGVGYMAFAAANPMLFRLMFNRETDAFETPALEAAAKATREQHFSAIEAALPRAPQEVKVRMSDFAWATVHGFITLVLEGQVGEKDSSRGLKARGMAILAAMAETVVRAGGAVDD
jgi:AcrR family transcriptional regulator